MIVILNAKEIEILNRHVEGLGGWQSIFKRLQNNLNVPSGEITISSSDVDKIRRYSNGYGDGGWQGRLRKIFVRHFGPNLNS